MSENETKEIFEKARFLGLNTDGLDDNEKLQNIANQVGLPDYQLYDDPMILYDRLDDLYSESLNESLNEQLDKYNNELEDNIKNDNIVDTSSLFAQRDESADNNQSQPQIPNYANKFNQYNRKKSNNSQDSRLQAKLAQNRNRANHYNKALSSSKKEDVSNINDGKQLKKGNDIAKKELAKKGLKALGVPSFFTNMISKQTSESNGGNADILSFKINTTMVVGGLLFIIAVIIIVVACLGGLVSQDDESELNSSTAVTSYITGTADSSELTNTLVYMDLCISNDDHDVEVEECLNSPAGKYFTHLKELYKSYQEYEDKGGNPLELNIGLILETISYQKTDLELFDEDSLDSLISQADALAEAQVEHYQQIGDLYVSTGNTCTIVLDEIVTGYDFAEDYYRISNDKYNSYLLYGEVHENYKDEIKVYDVDIHPNSDSNCIPDGRSYQSIDDTTTTTSYSGNYQDGYIYKYISNKYQIDDTEMIAANQEALNEIYERANVNYGTGFSSVSCPGVMVTGDYAGVYSLEDYIAGVIQNENNWYQGDNIENMKAQAVAARTYVLRMTANCTLPIENSTTMQTFNPNSSEQSKKAAQETASQVLVDDSGDYISTEYDALAIKEITDNFYILKQANLQIPISWIESNISSDSLEYYEQHHHGRGMSQWGSRYLQTQGYTYDQILSTFYTTGKLTTLGSSITNNIPSNVNDLKNRYYFNFDINYYQGNTLFGQCVWYAKHRAMEILATSSLDESTKQTLINSINNTGGNGQDWFRTPDPKYFKKSNNIYEPKAGSIVSWTRGQYGHVAIIEAVFTNEKGETMVTITEGWRQKGSNGSWYVTNDLWSVVKFSKKDLTLSQLQTYSGIFNGYVYLY